MGARKPNNGHAKRKPCDQGRKHETLPPPPYIHTYKATGRKALYTHTIHKSNTYAQAEGGQTKQTLRNSTLCQNVAKQEHIDAGDGSSPRDIIAAWRRDPVRELDSMQWDPRAAKEDGTGADQNSDLKKDKGQRLI